FTEVGRERAAAPGHLRGPHDRGESRDGLVELGMSERECERTVTAHGMAEDSAPTRELPKRRLNQRGELLAHVGFHPIVLAPGTLRRVEIETGALAESVLSGSVRNVSAARTRVRPDHDHPMPRGPHLHAPFGHAV